MVGDQRWFSPLPHGLIEQVLLVPAVRPGVVERVRQRLAARLLPPPALVVATSVVDTLVADRRT